MALPVLWQYNFSNFNEKARWALDFKGAPHIRRSLLPGSPRALWFSRNGTLPVLDLDGRRIVDSTSIIEALEGCFPEPRLYPEDPSERQRALEWEEFLDEEVGHELRRAAFYDLREDRDFVVRLLTTGRGRATRLAFRAITPVAWAYARRRYRFYEDDARLAKTRIRDGLDRIAAELQPTGYLVGSGFSVADLTAASLLFPLVWPSDQLQYSYPKPPPWEFGDSLRSHPAAEWVAEIYRGHRGTSAECSAGN